MRDISLAFKGEFYFFLLVLANDKEMVPRRDYEDYSKYVNETHASRK